MNHKATLNLTNQTWGWNPNPLQSDPITSSKDHPWVSFVDLIYLIIWYGMKRKQLRICGKRQQLWKFWGFVVERVFPSSLRKRGCPRSFRNAYIYIKKDNFIETKTYIWLLYSIGPVSSPVQYLMKCFYTKYQYVSRNCTYAIIYHIKITKERAKDLYNYIIVCLYT